MESLDFQGDFEHQATRGKRWEPPWKSVCQEIGRGGKSLKIWKECSGKGSGAGITVAQIWNSMHLGEDTPVSSVTGQHDALPGGARDRSVLQHKLLEGYRRIRGA